MGPDRREGPTRFLSRYTFFGGRRERGRRAGEDTNIFVDRFGQGAFLAAAVILLLNALDAVFTMLFLGLGAVEVNPVSVWLLRIGPWAFLLAKTLGIGCCTAYLVLVCRFQGAKIGFGFVIVAYTALLAWHLYLYAQIG